MRLKVDQKNDALHLRLALSPLLLVVAWGCAPGPTALPEPVESPARLVNLLANGLEDWVAHPPDPGQATWRMEEDGTLVTTGFPNGYLRTRTPYADYRLSVEWRWLGHPGNSGVLLHVHPPDRVWPHSIEAQLAAGHAGDFWVIGGASFAEHTARFLRRTPKLHAAAERPPGEWNRMEITCVGDRIEVTVNGVLQNVATAASIQSGYIALQSEGAPVAFRRLHLRPLPREDAPGLTGHGA